MSCRESTIVAAAAQLAGTVEKQQKPFPGVVFAGIPQTSPLPNGQYLPGTSSRNGLFNAKGDLHRGYAVSFVLRRLFPR